MYGQSLLAYEADRLKTRWEPCTVCGKRATWVVWSGRYCCSKHN